MHRRYSQRGLRSRRRAAFSLVEIMVVVVIIGLLSGVVGVSVRSYLTRSRQNVARMEVAKISQALDTFYGEFNRYPRSEEGLEALAKKSDKFSDGLLSKLPVDPWGNAYEYILPGKNGPYDVVCYGADHREGGSGADADISSADLSSDRLQATVRQ